MIVRLASLEVDEVRKGSMLNPVGTRVQIPPGPPLQN